MPPSLDLACEAILASIIWRFCCRNQCMAQRKPVRYRIGEAATMLGVRVETLRRWERDGKLKVRRTKGGQRVVDSSEVARLLAAKGRSPALVSRAKAPAIVSRVSSPR